MAKQAFTDHPEFIRVSSMVNETLAEMAHKLDCIDALHAFRQHTDRVVDDMTKLLLRAYDRDHSAEAA